LRELRKSGENELGWSYCIYLEFSGNMSFVIFTGGCNLRCSYCHNPELIDGGEHISLEELYIKIKDSIDFIDAVVITGGEPLLQSNDTKKIFNFTVVNLISKQSLIPMVATQKDSKT
jgi:pyruvate-formate lyase-activating enzyme